jgi:hypothetical protein
MNFFYGLFLLEGERRWKMEDDECVLLLEGE